MSRWLALALVIFALATAVTPAAAWPQLLEPDGSLVPTEPRADDHRDGVLPDGFAERPVNAMDARFGVVLIVLLLAGLALAAYTVHVVFAEPPPRRL